MLKYHLPISSKLKIDLASGWSYNIKQFDYYIFETDSTMQHTFRNVTSTSDYGIPLLFEIEYPVLKKINIQASVKYNLNRQYSSTYSTGLGLSLKL